MAGWCYFESIVADIIVIVMPEKQKGGVNIDPQEMLAAGLHFGHRVSVSHPKMKPFLFGVRNAVQIIDLEKAAEKLKEALVFIQASIKDGKTILLVGTKIQIKGMLEETAKECGLPWVSERWLGGTLTNFETIKKRVDYLKNLEIQKASGGLEKYTKKERMKIEKEMQDLEKRLGGIKDLAKLPDIVFVCDLKKDSLAVREAHQRNIKVVGIVDTNIDPTLADYPILANDDAATSVRYVLGKVKEAILEVKEMAK